MSRHMRMYIVSLLVDVWFATTFYLYPSTVIWSNCHWYYSFRFLDAFACDKKDNVFHFSKIKTIQVMPIIQFIEWLKTIEWAKETALNYSISSREISAQQRIFDFAPSFLQMTKWSKWEETKKRKKRRKIWGRGKRRKRKKKRGYKKKILS